MESELARLERLRGELIISPNWAMLGALSTYLRFKENRDIETMATDGTWVTFNPEWTVTQFDAELRGTIAHEIFHPGLRHNWREGTRDHEVWNQSTDMESNPILRSMGIALPEGALFPEDFNLAPELTAEQMYTILRSRQSDPENKQPIPQGKQPGEVSKPGTFGEPGEGEESEGESSELSDTDWLLATDNVIKTARNAGKLPAGFDRIVSATKIDRTNWREVLWELISQTIPWDFSWQSPNRRMLPYGIFLPGIRNEGLPPIAIGIDVSGSITPMYLELMSGLLSRILGELMPEYLECIYCDTEIQGIERFYPGDTVTLTMRGGGGTRFDPVLDHCRENPPAVLIYLTDLYAPSPSDPGYPVIWVTESGNPVPAPFGRKVEIVI